ncbi:MAG: uracil phosphoribosyltransferase [Verrucomicrobiota bacterium]
MIEDHSAHPLVQHHLTLLRDTQTPTSPFRHATAALTQILVAEAAKTLSLRTFEVASPLETTSGAEIAGPVVFVPILRAGLGMLDAALSTIPHSSVGYIGMERDEETAVANCYYAKMPDLSAARQVYLIDPMLATGGSAIQCIGQLKERGATTISMICIIAAPEGIECLQQAHPDVRIVAGKVDRQLNHQKYILPGLGDFGDRLFQT